jgi:hypothetical protein
MNGWRRVAPQASLSPPGRRSPRTVCQIRIVLRGAAHAAPKRYWTRPRSLEQGASVSKAMSSPVPWEKANAGTVHVGAGLLAGRCRHRGDAGTDSPAGDSAGPDGGACGTAARRQPIRAGLQCSGWNPPPPEPAAVSARAEPTQRRSGRPPKPRQDGPRYPPRHPHSTEMNGLRAGGLRALDLGGAGGTPAMRRRAPHRRAEGGAAADPGGADPPDPERARREPECDHGSVGSVRAWRF